MNENAENTRATAASREAMEKVCRFLKDTGDILPCNIGRRAAESTSVRHDSYL